MFYKMIENKCTQWYESDQCTVKNLIEYIKKTGQMRDAQIEAIKVYLFLKIACECKPLMQLFRQGFFNSIDLNEIELSRSARDYLTQNPAATALLEYSRLINDKGEQVSEKLERQIKKTPEEINYNEFFRNAFYGVSYTDYLFSLPMGAGKTYLMAAFIYLDLYFAYNEPTNPVFAHNFIILAPSGLKSSVIPSLKTIQNFDPAWILPEPAVTEIQLYRNPAQTMDKIKSLIPGLKNEDSLDSFWEGAISDSKLGIIPVYVPNLMDSTSKLLDKVTMNRIIHQAIPDLDNTINKVIVYYVDIVDESEIQNFIWEDDSTTVQIELRDLKTILDDVIIGDYTEFHIEETSEGYKLSIDKFLSDRVLSKIAEFNQKAYLKFVVVDLTHRNNGAYFEEGYAMGLGKTVIQLCKKGTPLHFDIAQKNTILWEKEEEIPLRLKDRIDATVE